MSINIAEHCQSHKKIILAFPHAANVLEGRGIMKTIIFAVVFVGLMSAQFYGAAAPQVGQVYRWESDTPFGYSAVVPKTQLTVIEVYGSGVKLKDATGNEYTINNSMFQQYLGLQMLVSATPKKRATDDKSSR